MYSFIYLNLKIQTLTMLWLKTGWCNDGFLILCTFIYETRNREKTLTAIIQISRFQLNFIEDFRPFEKTSLSFCTVSNSVLWYFLLKISEVWSLMENSGFWTDKFCFFGSTPPPSALSPCLYSFFTKLCQKNYTRIKQLI